MVNFSEVQRVQLAKSTLLTSTWCPWDLFRSFKVCSNAKERMGCRKQWEATAPILSLVKLQPWFLSLQWKTCLQQNCSLGSCACNEGPALGQNTLMMNDDYTVYIICHFFHPFPGNCIFFFCIDPAIFYFETLIY